MRLLLIGILSFWCSTSLAGITNGRMKQLDSIVTNTDRVILTHLDSLHPYLHNHGQNDEERVFMFYGLFGIHYKYDFERKGKKDVREYTPYYTCKRKKGVCRDFAALFKELCDRSEIPCVIASGRTDVGIGETIGDFFKGKLRRSNHAWNIVKYDEEWHLMDVTWSGVKNIEKYYIYDEDKRRLYAGRVKRPLREYYDIAPENMYSTRNAVHPAYYMSGTVYTYTSVRKNEKRRKIVTSYYDYSTVLDSLAANKNYKFTKQFYDASIAYSKNAQMPYFYRYEVDYLKLKRTQNDALTVESCEEHLEEIQSLVSFIEKEHGINLSIEFSTHKSEVLAYKNKLIQRAKRVGKIAVLVD